MNPNVRFFIWVIGLGVVLFFISLLAITSIIIFSEWRNKKKLRNRSLKIKKDLLAEEILKESEKGKKGNLSDPS